MNGPLEVVNRDMAAFNARDVDAQLSVFRPDAQFAAPGVSGCGRQEVAGFSHAWWAAFPDARLTCERTALCGCVVVIEGTFTGTHVATLRLPGGEFPATGQRMASRFAAVHEVKDGLIVSKRLYFDHLALQQPQSPSLPQLVGELSMSMWALTVLSCADEAGLLDNLDQPRSPQALARHAGAPAALVEAVLDVLLALRLVRREGAAFIAEPVLTASLTGPARALIRAELRSHLMQSEHLTEAARHGVLSTGWRHTDPQVLQAQGTRSSAVATAWADHVFATLDGLRLDAPGATFLDVGAGVAAIAIELCRRFPGLQAVGLDPWTPALAEAHTNIETSQLSHRISLREGKIEELADDAVFDLVHLPALFLSAKHVNQGLRRVRTALKPGGWVLVQVLGVSGPGLTPAVLRLWSTLWGGEPSMIPARAEQLLADAGFGDIRTLPPLPGPPVRNVVGRRLPEPDNREAGQ